MAGAVFKSYLALVGSHTVNQIFLKSVFISLGFDSTPLPIANKITHSDLASKSLASYCRKTGKVRKGRREGLSRTIRYTCSQCTISTALLPGPTARNSLNAIIMLRKAFPSL